MDVPVPLHKKLAKGTLAGIIRQCGLPRVLFETLNLPSRSRHLLERSRQTEYYDRGDIVRSKVKRRKRRARTSKERTSRGDQRHSRPGPSREP